MARRLAVAKLDAAHVAYESIQGTGWVCLQVGSIAMHVTDGRSAVQMAAQGSGAQSGVLDLPLLTTGALGIAFAPGVTAVERAMVFNALSACGFQPVELRELPGLSVARTIAMLVNESADTVWQGVCSESDADLAMKLGTNYPAGPFEWLDRLDVDYVVYVLHHMSLAAEMMDFRQADANICCSVSGSNNFLDNLFVQIKM